MWFMNNTKGVFLKCGGGRYGSLGSGTTSNDGVNTAARYWTSDASSNTHAHSVLLYGTAAGTTPREKTDGYSVRCVKGTKQ